MKWEELVIRIGLVALLIVIETCAPENAVQPPPEPTSDTSGPPSGRLLHDAPGRVKRVLRDTADELSEPEVRLIIRAARNTLRNMPGDR